MALNVLVIDRSPPVTPTQGNELIARNVFPLLRGRHRLTLVAPANGDLAALGSAIDGLFDEVHLVPRPGRLAALGGWVEGTLAGRPGVPAVAGLQPRPAAALADAVRQIIATGRIDVVHVRQLPMAGYGRFTRGTPRLLELIDAETLATTRDPATGWKGRVRRRLAPAIERRAMRGYGVVTAVAEPDAGALRRLGPTGRVEVVPNGVDLDVFRPIEGAPRDPAEVVFVGAMSFGPNIAAARWFALEVMPRLRGLCPEAHFTIVGRDPDPPVLALAGAAVTVTGRVDDVRPYLARAAVVVAPLVSGSGIKNKVLEALAMQRPVVAASLAVEGLAADVGRDLVVADGPHGVARAVADLLADEPRADAVAAAGRQLVERRYSWRAAADRYAALYAELAAGPTRR